MPRKKLVMRQVIEILRLKHEHLLSVREIARSCGVAPSTVGDYLVSCGLEQKRGKAPFRGSKAHFLSEIRAMGHYPR